MSNRPFVKAAKILMNHYQMSCVGLTFDTRKPFGILIGELGEPLLNLAVEGALMVMNAAGEFDDHDIDKVFHQSSDREEFIRWAVGLRHTFDGTMPVTAEALALKGLDERANATVYGKLGLHVTTKSNDLFR